MNYCNGEAVRLGDIVSVPVPGGTERARVVMLGDTYAHLAIDPAFVEWVVSETRLDSSSLVVEWIDRNPFAHDDPNSAPVGNYMFSPVDDSVVRIASDESIGS